MEKKNFVRWLIMGIVFGLVVVFTSSAFAQDQGPNLLVNGGFEQGHHKQDGAAELTVPDGWTLHYVDNASFPGSNGVAYRPESVVWYIEDAPMDERSLFFRDGAYAVKVFKGWAPMYSALSQNVNNLVPGKRYRLVAPIYIDIVENYENGQKIAPGKLDAGQVRLGASPQGAAWRDEGAISYSGWWNAGNVNPFYLAYPVFVHEFTATQPNMTVWVEFAAKEAYRNNAFFMDTFGLYEIGGTAASSSGGGNAAPAQPLPSPTPGPTPTPRADGAIIHVVQPGDSFWTIAIRYAPALNMTPEEALPHIREINNDPAFIATGQELFIALPNAAAAEPTAVPTEAETAAEEPTAAAEEGGGSETAAEEPTPEPEPTAVPEAAQPAANLGTVCVAAYMDNNSDGAQDTGEALVADAAITLSRAGNTVATYVSDVVSEPYCFEGLEADNYQVQIFPPANFGTTTADSWAVALTEGIVVPVAFGVQEQQAVAAVDTTTTEAPAAEPTAVPAAPADEGGLFSNLGPIIIGAAVMLVLLAGIGVVLLRRG